MRRAIGGLHLDLKTFARLGEIDILVTDSGLVSEEVGRLIVAEPRPDKVQR